MHILKRIGRGLSSVLLKFSLLAFAVLASAVMVFGTPTQLKKSLQASGVYGSLVDNVIQTSAQNNSDNGGGIPLDRPEVKNAVHAAVTPQFLQTSTEQIIDGTYHWLNGTVPAPDFNIDVSGAKQNLANSLADYAVNRAQSLPACTLTQARELQQSSIDPYNIPCLPPGISVASLKSQVVSSVTGSNDFLKDPAITVNTFPKDSEGKSVFDRLSMLPKIFHWLKLAPFALDGVILLTGLGLVFLDDDRRRGLRNLGMTLLGIGLFLAIGVGLMSYLFNRANQPNGSLGKLASSNALQKNTVALIQSLNSAFMHKLFLFCAVYIVIGVSILLALRLTRHKKPKTTPEHDDEKPHDKDASAKSDEENSAPTDESTEHPSSATKEETPTSTRHIRRKLY